MRLEAIAIRLEAIAMSHPMKIVFVCVFLKFQLMSSCFAISQADHYSHKKTARSLDCRHPVVDINRALFEKNI